MHTTRGENTNAQVKMGKGTCVSLAFLKNTIFPLFSTKHVALRKNYSTRNSIPSTIHTTQSNKQTIEMGLFNNLDLLRCYDKKDMVKDCEI
jgi:hypothetical protein